MLLLALVSSATLFAQTGEAIRNHTIIAIDERVSGQYWKPWDNDVRDMVERYLFEPIVIDGDTLYGGEPLYKDGDYLSIVTFSLGCLDEKIDAFTGIASYDQVDYKFVPYSSTVRRTIRDHWYDLARIRPLHDARHSIFSIAVPHALSTCRREKDDQLTNRTFVLMITDRSYSDKTYFDDIRDFTDQQWARTKGHAISKSDLIGVSQSVSKDYFINWINQDERRYQFWTSHQLRTKNVDLYELQPLQEHLRLPAVIRYPEKIVAQRGRFGRYTASLTMSPEDSVRFNVLRVEAILFQDGIAQDTLSYRAASPRIPFEKIAKTFRLDKRKTNTYIELRAWVNLLDGTYDATVLSPSRNGAAYLGQAGLNMRIPVEYEPRARTVFGLLPLWGIFCLSGDQGLDATIINLLIIIWAILGLLLYIIKTRSYEPTLDEIEITYKNREK